MKYLAVIVASFSFMMCFLLVFTGSYLPCEFVEVAIFSTPCGLISGLYLLNNI